MHRLSLLVLVCFLITSCRSPSHRKKYVFERDGQSITCFGPPPDVVTTTDSAVIDAQVKALSDLAKGSVSRKQTVQKIRDVNPELQSYETVKFRLCVDYANGLLSKEQYNNSTEFFQLLGKTPHVPEAVKELPPRKKTSKTPEAALTKPSSSKMPLVEKKTPPFPETASKKATITEKGKTPRPFMPLYSSAWERYGEDNRGVRIQQHGTSIKLSFSGKGDGTKKAAYFQTVPVANMKNLVFTTKLNISDDEGSGIPVAKLEFLDHSGRELFHIALTPNSFYQSNGLYARYPIEYGNNVTVEIRPKELVKGVVSSESLSMVRQLRVSYEISVPKMHRCRRCAIEVFEANIYSDSVISG